MGYIVHRQPVPLLAITAALLVGLNVGVGCFKNDDPQTLYEHARTTFVHGNLADGQKEAEVGYQKFRRSSPQWGWKFRTLEAESLLWRGMYGDVLKLLDAEPDGNSLKIKVLALRGAAHARLHQFPEAEHELGNADRLCANREDSPCGDVIRARGVLANQRGQGDLAYELFKQSLSFARTKDDQLLGATALLNLGAVSLKQERFDEAMEWSDAAYQAAERLNADDLAQAALGNVGWARYRLGDSEGALAAFLHAKERATKLGDYIDEASWGMDAGYVYSDLHDFGRARESFLRALDLAGRWGAKEAVFNGLRALARLSLLTDDFEGAGEYSRQSLQMAHDSGIHSDELYPMLVEGEIAARNGDADKAQQTFETVERDPVCPAFLKWEAQHSLARLSVDHHDPVAAEREYRAALDTFESARATVRHEDSQLSFLTNAAGIYDDYLDFLVKLGRSAEALQWADYGRARTLSEGLGLLSKENAGGADWMRATQPKLNPQSIAQRGNGTILFYWLGEKQSYLWAITPRRTHLFTLPPLREIETAVRRYRAALTGPANVLESSTDGSDLYRILIAPVQSLLKKNSRVFIVPDGELNNLNFETLISPLPAPHYWIEDVNVVNTPSLRILSASLHGGHRGPKRLLLIGDSTSPSKDYPELAKAADQMSTVERHFANAQKRVFHREHATPSAYLDNNPQQFSYIHFVAHGTASRLDPLDSAIVLSKEPNNPDSFKLYAREITQRRIHAELVTISACYSAGERHYSGEGMVGLAWAFIRAGSRNVVAALWEVTDVSTDQLMDRFYDELSRGATPDAALRAAKLALLREGRFRSPFYWAPLQLFRG